MHPAYSVIFFTTASGAGYGLLFWLALGHAIGTYPTNDWGFALGLVLALALISAGLLSSTFHLGHPERAWRALSQWRSSWLSREGVAALLTYLPSGLLTLCALFGFDSFGTLPLALLSAAGAGLTVYCTGMIYACLKTVREWHSPQVPLIYLSLSAMSGAVLLALLVSIAGKPSNAPPALAFALLCVSLALKLRYFRHIDRRETRFTAAEALGMGTDHLRPLDPPHTQPNFVMREMGYAVARRHALRLRRIALLCLFGLPALALALTLLTGAAPVVFALLATAFMAAGLVMERWLFFAEATHVSMLYYGAKAA